MLPSGLPELIAGEEDLARFLTSSSQFNSIMVKPAAFLPNPHDGETSAFRHGAEPRNELWQIAHESAIGDRTLHGAAIVRASDVRLSLLEAVSSEPPPRHAVIVGWPWYADDPEMQRAHQKERAAKIASSAILVQP